MAVKTDTPDWMVAYKLPGEEPRYRKCRGRNEAREVRHALELEAFDTALYRKLLDKWLLVEDTSGKTYRVTKK
jgi:hypothetical protein